MVLRASDLPPGFLVVHDGTGSYTNRGKRIGTARTRVFLVQWRNGRATGGVYVVSLEGAVTPVAALRGARKQNRRMTAQLPRG